MFGFLKKTIKGFVDQFKREDEAEKEASQSEKAPEKVRAEESLSISPEDIAQDRMAEAEYEVERRISKEAISPPPEKDELKEDFGEIQESIIQKEEKKDDAAEKRTAIHEEKERQSKGLFSKIAESITKKALTDEEFDSIFHDMEISLLENNTALDVVEKIKETLRMELQKGKVQRRKPHEIVREGLISAIKELFIPHEPFMQMISKKKPYIIMFLGVNGSGKTTTIAKIAYNMKNNGITPVMAAGDTFRAAAIQQLEEHAKRIGVRIIKHDYGADPAAVAYDAIRHAESGKAGVVLIDTAGRLHSNDNLLKELEKIKRVSKPDLTLFVGEAIAGNDVIEQAMVFNEKIGIDGIILTKADVDDKGGAALSVSYVTRAPIYFIGLGQGYDDLKEFTPELVMSALGLE